METTVITPSAKPQKEYTIRDTIRTIVRGTYDLQKVRIQMGNRITGNFKAKLGLKQDGMSEKDLAAQDKKMLDELRADYKRITDPIAAIVKAKNQKGKKTKSVTKEEELSDIKKDVVSLEVEESLIVDGKLPSKNKFVPGEIISTYSELTLVHAYISMLSQEEKQFRDLEGALTGIPLYDNFLRDVDGVGTAMSGVLISEIDIAIPKYASSIHKYAGLDVVTIGQYVDEDKKEHTVPARMIEEELGDERSAVTSMNNPNEVYQMKAPSGQQLVLKNVGRSRHGFCLVKKEYINKEGNVAERDSITFNPFLKTKLIGVLGSSFLRAGKMLVDGKKLGAALRLKLALEEGFVQAKGKGVEKQGDQVMTFLQSKGHVVSAEPSVYGRFYYDYKNRIENMPAHADKTDGHRHNMAIRYMIKRFLVDYYVAAKTAAGLPVMPEYSEGKLGIIHTKKAA